MQVIAGVLADEVAGGTLREWLHKQRTGFPHVTWNSRPVSTVEARRPTAAVSGSPARPPGPTCIGVAGGADAIMVGTGTVFIDDPTLTARLADGSLADRQPLRVVVGEREISPDANVLNDDSRTMVIRTRDPHEVIQSLSDRTDVILEGGPTLAGAFLRAG